MRRFWINLLALVLAFVFAACAGPRIEQKPDHDAVRQRHKQTSPDLQREEDKRSEDEDEEDEE